MVLNPGCTLDPDAQSSPRPGFLICLGSGLLQVLKVVGVILK